MNQETTKKALAKAHDQICQLTNELEDYRHRMRALILERDRFQHLAEQKLGLRRELEEFLGMKPGQPCSDAVFEEGVKRLRALVAGHREWKQCAEELAKSLKLWHPHHGILLNKPLAKFKQLKGKQ